MADIYTHLRELGVAICFYSDKSSDEITPEEFVQICKQNILMDCKLTTDMISHSMSFCYKEKETLRNAFKLAGAIKKNFKISKTPKIVWVGCNTQSDTPVDLIIDNYKFSLKEQSFIFENMGLYKLLNILTDTEKYSSGLHVFKEFAPTEFNDWFKTTCKLLLKHGPQNFMIDRPDNYCVKAELKDKSLYLEYSQTNKVLLENIEKLDYNDFERLTNGLLREKIFSKLIKEKVEKDETYIKAKKYCAQKAGENILSLVKSVEKSSPKKLQRFFRIMEEEYYYAKTTNKSLAIYKVPSSAEAKDTIIINSISIDIPCSQLNFLTEIKNIKTDNTIVFRNELRYSHGQFNGTPEAKCYVARKSDLSIIYEKIV